MIQTPPAVPQTPEAHALAYLDTALPLDLRAMAPAHKRVLARIMASYAAEAHTMHPEVADTSLAAEVRTMLAMVFHGTPAHVGEVFAYERCCLVAVYGALTTETTHPHTPAATLTKLFTDAQRRGLDVRICGDGVGRLGLWFSRRED